MIANYHTHTHRCHHATGSEREYIEYAIARGLDTLGFSDHVPVPFPDGHQSWFRIQLEDISDYVHTLQSLREEYRDRIRILIGFEAEYYPALFENMLKLLGSYDYDYLIMGQHYSNNEWDGVYNAEPQKDEGILCRYVDQVLSGLSTGKFTYLAHPDLANFIGDEAVYEQQMKRLCQGCLTLNVPLEINLLGLMGKRHYPSDRFFRIVREVGNPVVIGCDAHRACDVADPVAVKEGYAFAEKYGLRVLDHVPLRDPKGS